VEPISAERARSPAEFYNANEEVASLYSPSPSTRTTEDLYDAGLVPKCMALSKHSYEFSAITSNVVGDAVTRKDAAGSDMRDLELWLGDGRLATDFTGAKLLSTRFEGADLRNTLGLTQAQLDSACVDKWTLLPIGFLPPARRCLKVIRDRDGGVTSTLIQTTPSATKTATCAWESNTSFIDAEGKLRSQKVEPADCADPQPPH
jgi:hypothetical protein